MRRLPKTIKYILLGIAIMLLGLLVFLQVFDFTVSQQLIDEKLKEAKGKTAVYDTLQFSNAPYPLTLLDNKAESDSIVIFIHGSPGSARDFLSFYENGYGLENFRLITLERPGYSGASKGAYPIHLEEQIAPLAAYLESLPREKSIFLVSHSYGGAPAGMLAARYPEIVDGLLLGSVLIDPKSEPVWWFNHLLALRPLHWVLPDFLIFSNMEKMSHKEELKGIQGIWPTIECPIYLLHGRKDWIAPFGNVNFAKRVFSKKKNIHFEIVKDMGHLIQLREQYRIAKGIHWLAKMHSLSERKNIEKNSLQNFENSFN